LPHFLLFIISSSCSLVLKNTYTKYMSIKRSFDVVTRVCWCRSLVISPKGSFGGFCSSTFFHLEFCPSVEFCWVHL
jgi:hypothetical protein